MADQTAHNVLLINERRRQVTDVSNTTTKQKPAAKPKAAKAKSKATKPAAKQAATTAGKPAATPKAPKPLAPEIVELVALLKTKKGATNEEAATRIKGFKTARDVRAANRDKVRKLIVAPLQLTKEHDAEREGVVFRIETAADQKKRQADRAAAEKAAAKVQK